MADPETPTATPVVEASLYTDEQILLAISDALTDRDMESVAALLGILARQAPRKAQLIVDAIKTGEHPLESLMKELS